MKKSSPSFNDMKKNEDLEKGFDRGTNRSKAVIGYGTDKERPMSPSQRMVINSKSVKSGRQNTDGVGQQAGAAAAKERRTQMRKEGLIKERPSSYNDMKKNEDLEKTGTMTKLALAAALAGPIVTHQKGTLFDDTETPITRSIAGEPTHEKEDDSGKHEAIKHVIGQKPYTITHVTSEAKAPAMKEKFKSIRNQIKGNE